MNKLLALFSVLEVGTGVALMLAPSAAAKLLLGGDISGAGVVVGRVAGIALVSLGFACWPKRGQNDLLVVRGMFTYNLLVTCYLILLGIGGQFVGVLLWPAASIHGLLTLLVVWELITTRQIPHAKG